MPATRHRAADPAVEIRPVTPADRAWIAELLRARWGSPRLISRGREHDAGQLPGFVAWRADRRLGLATYEFAGGQCELVSLDSLAEWQGVGTTLVAAVRGAAAAAGCDRLWLITTNDNLPALGFYQKRGFRLVAVHRDALAASRRLKPEIPARGRDGIPLRDEIELELPL